MQWVRDGDRRDLGSIGAQFLIVRLNFYTDHTLKSCAHGFTGYSGYKNKNQRNIYTFVYKSTIGPTLKLEICVKLFGPQNTCTLVASPHSNPL